jgi:hypothetical protein
MLLDTEYGLQVVEYVSCIPWVHSPAHLLGCSSMAIIARLAIDSLFSILSVGGR